MLNDYRHFFIEDISTNIMVTQKICAPKLETVISYPGMVNKTLDLLCVFPKPLAGICMNHIHVVLISYRHVSKQAPITNQPYKTLEFVSCISQLRVLGTRSPNLRL